MGKSLTLTWPYISHRCRVCCVKHSVVQIKGFMYSDVFVTAIVFKRIFSLDDDLSQKKATKKIKIRFHSTIHCGLPGNKTEARVVISWFPIDYILNNAYGTYVLGNFRCAINLPINLWLSPSERPAHLPLFVCFMIGLSKRSLSILQLA